MDSEVTKRDFNLAAKILLGLTVLGCAVGIVTNIINFSSYSRLGIGGNQTHLLKEALMNALIIVSAVLIYRRNKYGLYLFLFLAILRVFVTIPTGTDISYSYYLGGKTAYFIRDFIPFAIAMCFKKNGISGWKALTASDDYIETHTIIKDYESTNIEATPAEFETSEKEDSQVVQQAVTSAADTPVHAEIITQQETNVAAEKVPDNMAVKAESVSPNNSLADNDEDKPRKPHKPIKWKTVFPIVGGSVIGAAIIALVIVVLSGTYPEHFDSFGDKFKHRFGMHNNSLAKEYLEKFRSAEKAGLDEMSKEFAEVAYKANPSNRIVLDSLSQVYYELGETWTDDIPFYEKAIEVCEKGLKKYPNDKELMRTYIRSSYQISDKDGGKSNDSKEHRKNAYKMAEKLLLEDPNSMLGYYVMCFKSSDDKDWKSLLRWAEKGLAQEGYSNNPQFMYFKAKGLFETGQYGAAKEVYYQAEKIEPNNYLHAQYAIIGGLPCEILSVEIENTMNDQTIVTKAGNTLYDDITRYLGPVVTVKPLRNGRFNFDIKFFQDGELRTGDSSPDGYSYSSSARLQGSDKQTIRLGGWGSDKPGHWGNGGYRIEIWWAGEKLFTKSFNVYSGYWHNLGYGNRFD